MQQILIPKLRFSSPRTNFVPKAHPKNSLLFRTNDFRIASSNLFTFTSFANKTQFNEAKTQFQGRDWKINTALPWNNKLNAGTIILSEGNSNFQLFKNQKRNMAQQRVILERYEDKSNDSFSMFLAGLAAVALGTLVFYGFSNSEDKSETTKRLRQSFLYLTSGLGVTAVSAKLFFNSGIAFKMATMNPWLSLGLTFAGVYGSMILATSIPYENTIPKHLAYYGFNSMIGLSLCPMVSLGGPLLLKAAVATGAVVTALGATAAASPEGTFLAWGGPLSVGLGVVFAASLGNMFFPASSLLYNIALYGGAGVFGLFVLHDVDKMNVAAKYSRHYDPINGSLHLYMDIINLFIRIAQMMAMSNNKK